MCFQVLDEFTAKIPQSMWATESEASIAFPQVATYLAKYQNPREADAMTKMQEELDETKIILVSSSFRRRNWHASEDRTCVSLLTPPA